MLSQVVILCDLLWKCGKVAYLRDLLFRRESCYSIVEMNHQRVGFPYEFRVIIIFHKYFNNSREMKIVN